MIEIEGIPSFGRVGHYERKGLYSIDEVLSQVGLDPDAIADFDGDPIKMHSLRYRLFRSNLICVHCGLVGAYFAKERSISLHRPSGKYWATSLNYHFNLYCINKQGHETMLTKDHIMPRAHGGTDAIENLQTMCTTCNARKRDRLPGESNEEFAARKAAQKNIERMRSAATTRGFLRLS